MTQLQAIALSGLVLAGSAALCGAAPKADVSKLPPASAKSPVQFTEDIKPIFDKSCVRCHGPEKPKAALRLDSLKGALTGSEHGKVLQPGKPTESLLLIAVARIGADPDGHMPPLKNKAGIQPLTAEQVSLIRAWIEQGAK